MVETMSATSACGSTPAKKHVARPVDCKAIETGGRASVHAGLRHNPNLSGQESRFDGAAQVTQIDSPAVLAQMK